MAEYYKHEIAKWNVATDDLTLEQEAAYHRVVATIRLYERPFRHNLRVLTGLWRCNERKAKRLLDELVMAGKLKIEDGFIIDEKAVDDASILRQSRVDKQLAGRLGGIESGKARRKSLEINDPSEAPALTREEKRREEKEDTVAKATDKTSLSENFGPNLPNQIDPAKLVFDAGVAMITKAGTPERQARAFLGKLRKDHQDAAIFEALTACGKAGAVDPIPWLTAALGAATKAKNQQQINDEMMRAAMARI